MKKLWQKNWELDSFIESFETKDDLLLDQYLAIYDVYGSIAHVRMLTKIGILQKQEQSKLLSGFAEILYLIKINNFILEQGDEDIHTKIENFLIVKYGDVGKKVHTGRSRNDQVLTAMRLFSKEKLLYIWKNLLLLIESFLVFAKKYEFQVIPGYTHTQKAMPSSVGMWAGAFIEAFFDDLNVLKVSYSLNDKSPLGSAAGYGVPLPLDREYVSELLGFSKLQLNSLYCQNSRGKIEAIILSALNNILLDINKFATDVLLFTTSEFDYFKIAKKLCSGSSIMPQKNNVDIAELLRSKVHITAGNYIQILSLSSNLISGYNRDLQDSKKPFMVSLEVSQDSIKVAKILISNITPNKVKLKNALTPELFATHKAIDLVKNGMSFREAYQIVSSNSPKVNSITISNVLKQSEHIGGTGCLGLEIYSDLIKKEMNDYKYEHKKYKFTIKTLVKGGDKNE